MEEPGNLDIESFNVVGNPPGGNLFLGSNLEFEYGVKTWWTSEFYLDGQITQHESTIFTGFRWENRFRPSLSEHVINPVIYIEYENISSDKALREVIGHDGLPDFAGRNNRGDVEREMELKLILGSNLHGWNISENIIAEKNLGADPWEFGYAWASQPPYRARRQAHNCTFCPKNFRLASRCTAVSATATAFGLQNTSHYVGPTINWTAPNGTTLSFSPQFGLNDYSIPRLYRFGISYEIEQFLSLFHREAQ